MDSCRNVNSRSRSRLNREHAQLGDSRSRSRLNRDHSHFGDSRSRSRLNRNHSHFGDSRSRSRLNREHSYSRRSRSRSRRSRSRRSRSRYHRSRSRSHRPRSRSRQSLQSLRSRFRFLRPRSRGSRSRERSVRRSHSPHESSRRSRSRPLDRGRSVTRKNFSSQMEMDSPNLIEFSPPQEDQEQQNQGQEQQNQDQEQQNREQGQTAGLRSLSPVLKRKQKNLSPMSASYRKTLHDEVVQIIRGLDESLYFDLSKTFAKQKNKVNKKLLPAIKKAMNPTINAYNSEIVQIIRQLHKSRRELWRLKQVDGGIEKHRKGQHVTSRRDQKMGRRRRGLQHMILTKDSTLTKCHPKDDISWSRYMKDCESAVNNGDVHSDEYSTNDEALAEEERGSKKRPENVYDSNSVIKVHEKPWRSTRIKKILTRAEEIGISLGTGLTRVRYRDSGLVDKKSRPKNDMPDWWISSTWQQKSDSDDEDEDESDIHSSDPDHNDDNIDDNNGDNDNNGNNSGNMSSTALITASA